jgi:hypothetical protein
MAAEALLIPDPRTVWVLLTMMDAKIQSLVDRGLLRPKVEVEWKAAVGKEFPTEDVKKQVIFASFFERGFNIPAEDFFRGLLFYYKLELVHLVPNSITVVSTFIHFCEACLGISPHFLLWRHLFCVKSTSKRASPVRAMMFYLRSSLKSEWIDTDLPNNTIGWRYEWFYITDRLPTLPEHTGHKPMKIPEWDLGLSSRDVDDIKEVLALVEDLNKRGVTGGLVARLFCWRLIQPIKDWVHPAYEYWGQSDPNREVNRKVSREDTTMRVSQIYAGRLRSRSARRHTC